MSVPVLRSNKYENLYVVKVVCILQVEEGGEKEIMLIRKQACFGREATHGCVPLQ
jgi:hypothetical protein